MAQNLNAYNSFDREMILIWNFQRLCITLIKSCSI